MDDFRAGLVCGDDQRCPAFVSLGFAIGVVGEEKPGDSCVAAVGGGVEGGPAFEGSNIWVGSSVEKVGNDLFVAIKGRY